MDWIDLALDRDSGRHLWMRQWTVGFHKLRGVSWLADGLLVSQEELCSIQGVSASLSSKEIWNLYRAIMMACTSICCDFDFVIEITHRKFSCKKWYMYLCAHFVNSMYRSNV
jgi:hypothetical protein